MVWWRKSSGTQAITAADRRWHSKPPTWAESLECFGPWGQDYECYGDVSTVDEIHRSDGCYPASLMEAKGLTPILNVSDIASTVAWFEKWGWKKLWDWGTPPTFGAVGSGKETCIFLCQGAQGGRGRGANTTTFQQDGDEEGDMPWNVREMHLRHPDGHVFRVGRGFEPKK